MKSTSIKKLPIQGSKSIFSKFAKFVLAILLLFTSVNLVAQTETLSTGSYIINMGVVPQTQSNALKPYGLVYDLLKNYNVPIKWVISQSKIKDGADFTYLGVDYKGGTFIIPAEFRNATVNSRIAFFGVTGTTTTSPLTVNVTFTLLDEPTWTLDEQNGNIAEDFFTKAGVPATAYNYKTPAQLNGCDEIYVMPHADPTWAYHGNLLNWVNNNKGSVWGGCRSGSGIENLFNPANPSQQLNFLSNNIGTAGKALVPHGSHDDGTPPYTHQFPSSVASQYMGTTDAAHQNGSEQIYLPILNGSWRPTTQVIAFDPTQSDVPSISPGLAAAIVFGRAFGDNNKGFVMYEGGHDIGGTSTAQIAAQRAFWNFSFRAAIDITPITSTISVPSVVQSANTYALSIAATSSAGGTLTYQWSSSCGGTFSNATSANTNFLAPNVTTPTNCTISVVVTNICGRSVTTTKVISLIPPTSLTNPDFNSTFVNVPVPGNVSTNDKVPTGTTYGTSPTLLSSPSGSVATLTMNSNGTYSFTGNTVGVYTYDVPVCVPGQIAPCPPTKLVITVLSAFSNTNALVANVDIATTNFNTPVTLNTLVNDAAGNSANALVPSTVTVTVAPPNGTTSVNPVNGNITYTPNAGFVGADTLRYQVCDNQSPAKCASALQIITVKSLGTITNTTTAADDYKITQINTATTGNVKTNDSDAEGNTQTVTAQTTTVAGKGTLVLAADGSYTFTPVSNFTGPVDFPYTTCDNGTPQACASATLHILVKPIEAVTNPDFNTTFVNVAVPGNVNTNDIVPAGTTYGTSPTLLSSPSGSVATLTMNSNGTYSFTGNTVGVYTYDVPVCVPGQIAPCPPTKLVITVLGANSNTNAPIANVDIATTNFNTPVTLNTLVNDAAGNPANSLVPSTVTVTVAPPNGTTSVNPVNGNITYTPNAGFVGADTLRYQVCDNQSPAKCATALQIITVKPSGSTVNTTSAADDYKITQVNTATTGNVKTNDVDAEGNTQTVTAQTTTVAGKGTLVLAADGSYTFTPVSNFTGPVDFPYTTCDNGTPQACASATLHILVKPIGDLPDLTPSIFNDGTTLVRNTSRDNVIRIFNIGSGPTTAAFTFTIPKMLPAFEITINPTETTMNVFGGLAVDNSSFTITEQSSRYVITSKPGVTIPSGGSISIGLKVKSIGIINSTGNLSVQIVFGTGGGETPINNNFDNNTYSIN